MGITLDCGTSKIYKSIYCKTQCTFRRHNNSINITYTNINTIFVSTESTLCFTINRLSYHTTG